MSFESVNYHYVPEQEYSENIIDTVKSCGGKIIKRKSISNFKHIVMLNYNL